MKNPKAVVHGTIFAERHWHDFFDDDVGAARSQRYQYIRNYNPDLPGTLPTDAVRRLTFQAMRRPRDGKLASQHLGCFLKPRPEEEPYDTETDPHELRKLASDPSIATTFNQPRRALTEWQRIAADRPPETHTCYEFDRETGSPLPSRSFERRPPKS